MKVFIIYAGVEDGQQVWPDGCSLALQRLAGSNVLGHVLMQLRDVQTTELILIVDRDEAAITAWIEDRIREIELKVIAVAEGSSPLQALSACRDYFDKEPLLVVLGDTITEADYKSLDQSTAGVTLFTRPPQEDMPDGTVTQGAAGLLWTGVCHFRQGTDLRALLERTIAQDMDILSLLNAQGDYELQAQKRPATMCLDTRTGADLLHANARLLGLGFGSEDAIERSYVEDFTVIPPVFLHETAVIENAVVGPFANIEAGAKISSSVVRNSLIGQESTIDNAILDGSIIGSRAHIQTSGKALFVEDNEELILK